MQIPLATNRKEHFKNCTKNASVLGLTQLYKRIQSYTNKEKWLLIWQFHLVANLSVFATDIRFCVIDLKAFCTAKWVWFVGGAGFAAECRTLPFRNTAEA